MGFNQCYLRNVENLSKEFNRNGLESFLKRYKKYDSLTGSTESFDFLESKTKQYEESINNPISIFIRM
jgi:biotin-(acetyl-CoA carboxylase) ligase